MVSRRAHRLGGAVTAVAVLMALTACAGGSGEAEQPEERGAFTIYMNTPLTGALSNAAKANVASLEVAIDAVNEAGGILDQQVELIVADDQLDTTRAVTLLQEQIDEEKPDLVFMGATSNTGLAMLPLLTRNQIISTALMQSSEINQPDLYPYAFIPYVESKADAAALVAEMEANGYESAALLTANDANGQSAAQGLTEAFAEAGITTTPETYTPTDVDMTSQLQRLQDADPDVLVIQAFGAATSHILSSRTKLGWDVPTLGHSSIGLGQNLAEISTEADWNNLYLGVFDVTAGTIENDQVFNDLIAQVKAKGDPVAQSAHYYSLYWDILWLMKKAFEQAGSMDPDAVKAALEDLQDNAEVDSQLITFPVEYMRWSPESHFFEIPGDVVFTYVRPGPLVDGVIQSVE